MHGPSPAKSSVVLLTVGGRRSLRAPCPAALRETHYVSRKRFTRRARITEAGQNRRYGLPPAYAPSILTAVPLAVTMSMPSLTTS